MVLTPFSLYPTTTDQWGDVTYACIVCELHPQKKEVNAPGSQSGVTSSTTLAKLPP